MYNNSFFGIHGHLIMSLLASIHNFFFFKVKVNKISYIKCNLKFRKNEQILNKMVKIRLICPEFPLKQN